MLLIGAGFWVFGMALHNEAPAAQEHKRYMDSIYYCAMGVEFSRVRALQGNERSKGHLMSAANHIYLVTDAGTR
jgi:hypothetical protein